LPVAAKAGKIYFIGSPENLKSGIIVTPGSWIEEAAERRCIFP
jgi:hypothetical protein